MTVLAPPQAFLLLQNLRDAKASLTVSEPYRFRKALGKLLRNTFLFFPKRKAVPKEKIGLLFFLKRKGCPK